MEVVFNGFKPGVIYSKAFLGWVPGEPRDLPREEALSLVSRFPQDFKLVEPITTEILKDKAPS